MVKDDVLEMPKYWENVLHRPEDCVPLLRDKGLHAYKEEHFFLVLVNSDLSVKETVDFASGTENRCVIDMKRLAPLLLDKKPEGLIIAHNHPNGIMEPSRFDNNLTAHVVFLCEALGIYFLDHLILGFDDYYSYKEHDSRYIDSKRFLKVAEE